MKKNLLKFVIICILAGVIGIFFYQKTDIGRQVIDDSIENIDTSVDGEDFESLLAEDEYTLEIVETGETGDIVETDPIVNSGAGKDPLQMQSGAIDELLQKRMEYYKQSKEEIKN